MNEPSSGKQGRYHHRALRGDLLRVAWEEIARHGAQAVTLASLARLAGVSQTAPYHHFGDREALLEAVAADAFASLTLSLAEAVRGREPDAAPDALALAYLGFGEANIEIYRLMFASRIISQTRTGSPLDVAANAALDLLRQTLSASSSTPDRNRLERDVYRTWAQLHGLVMLKADGFMTRPLAHYAGFPSEDDAEAGRGAGWQAGWQG